MTELSTPHGDKLTALRKNENLPEEDRAQVEKTIERYQKWRTQLQAVSGTYQEMVTKMVGLLNEYKRYVEIKLIFESKHYFLYRQKGQLKLDNTIIEEFLPLLVVRTLSDHLVNHDLLFGPTTCFSGIRFESAITAPKSGGGMKVKAKDHDFVISRKLFIRTSHDSEFQDNVTKQTHIAYLAAECKTNLDKTMFQEAAATALDVKTAVPGAKYYLLCEWLDMTPISTSTTAIDEIIILRKAKRLSSSIRRRFNTVKGRQENQQTFIDYLNAHPFSVDSLSRFLTHIRYLVESDTENDVLRRGYF
jgi:hypothetical protein